MFATAHTASGQLAAKNEELDAAKKEVETAKDALTTANNELTKATNDLTAAQSKKDAAQTRYETAENSYETAKANYDNAVRAYTNAEKNYNTAKTKYDNLVNELNTLKTTGKEVTLTVGLPEREQILGFLKKALVGTATTPAIYYNYDTSSGFNILSLSVKSGIKDEDGADLGFTEDKKVTPQTWKTIFSDEVLKTQALEIISFYCEVKYKVYASEDGENELEEENKLEEKVYYISSIEFADNITTTKELTTQFTKFVNAFKGEQETVNMIDEDAITAKQKEVNDQLEILNEREATKEQAEANKNALEPIYNKAKTTYETAGNALSEAEAAVTTAEGKVTTAEGKVTTATTDLTNAQGEVKRIEGEIATINASVAAVNNYKNLSITDNITIPALTAEEITAGKTLLTLGDWGSDCAINGNGYVITYPAGTNGNLTGVNRGIINNLGVENGKIAQTNGGTLKIAFETTNGTTYDIYDASGAHTQAPMDSALVNRARPYFGVKITEDKNGAAIYGKLEKKTDPTTVYKAEWTNAETKEKTVFYTNATYDEATEATEATGLSYNPAKGMANAFTYVLSNDLTVTDKFTEKNVVVKGICNNAEFTDNVAEGGRIYIPTTFTAVNLSYDRDFKSTSDLATVCLPFDVSAQTLTDVGVTKIMQFDYVETATNTYWFRYQGTNEAMKANEPYVLKCNGENFKGGKIFGELSNIRVAATKVAGTTENINPLAVKPSNDGNGAEFRGVFVATNASQLANGGKLYGFAEGLFRPLSISDKVKFSPFRTYIRASRESNVPAVTFNIGELDENGNIVDGGETGVTTAVKEADAFSVKGINGALVITSNKAQNVNIYTIGGSLVKATNVEAGTVTVPVAAGVYVVNGKKVFVK